MKIVNISVELIDHMGSDLSVVNAARVSMDKFHSAFEKNDTDLINYLAEHGHWSPFAHAFMSFRIKAPIFCARQLQKHTVGLAWNEVSRRYVDSEPEFYMPPMRKRAPNVKQGSKKEIVKDVLLETIAEASVLDDLETYMALLEAGVAPEVARAYLPQAMMTEWIWSGSLYAFARVCNLRLDSHAQAEAREVAKGILIAVDELFPVSRKALINDTAV